MSEDLRAEAVETVPVQVDIPAEVPAEAALPMRWHSFVCRFMLWMAAACHILQTILFLTGIIYFDTGIRDAVYAGLPLMRWLDWLTGAALAVAAAMQISAAVGLLRRRISGVDRLKKAYLLLTLLWFVYGMGRLLLTGLSPLSIPVAGQLLSCLALLLIHRSYYRRRTGAFAK